MHRDRARSGMVCRASDAVARVRRRGIFRNGNDDDPLGLSVVSGCVCRSLTTERSEGSSLIHRDPQHEGYTERRFGLVGVEQKRG